MSDPADPVAAVRVPQPQPEDDPVMILRGLLAIPGVRKVAEASVLGSIVWAADRVLAAAPLVAPAGAPTDEKIKP